MKYTLKKIINAFIIYIIKTRFWLMQKIFSDDEKYLIKRAIDDRIEYLEKIKVIERRSDSENIERDVRVYTKINWIFSTDSWN